MKKPTKLICGYKDNISPKGSRLTNNPTTIEEVVQIIVRTMPTGGSYIALGNEEFQERRLLTIGATIDIDFIDDLSKIVVRTDSGNDGCLEWIGG